MDKWVEEFQKKNGRKPTFEEFQAHAAEQEFSATGAAAGQPVEQAVRPSASTAPQPMDATIDGQTNLQPNNPEDPQQSPLAPTQNATEMPQNFSQANPYPAPKKPSNFHSKAKHFFRSPLGIAATVLAVFVIAFLATGMLTTTSRNRLQNKYNEAVKNRDVEALLALFPKSQTRSRFADIGAQRLISSQIPFNQLESASAFEAFSVTETRYLLFFKSYSLNAKTTKVDKGNTPEGGTLWIDDYMMNDSDFETDFFPGVYTIDLKIDNILGEQIFNTSIGAGGTNYLSLEFEGMDDYVTLPAGPNSISVYYNNRDTGTSLSDKPQRIGPNSYDVEAPKSTSKYVTFSGEYGGVKINKARLSDMQYERKLTLKRNKMLPFDSETVAFDKKKFDPYIQAFAKDWFKAGQKGSTEGFRTLDDLIKGTDAPIRFKNSNDIKYAFKGIHLNNYKPYRIYTGIGGYLYVVAKFNILYTSTEVRQNGTKPTNEQAANEIIFRIDKDGELKAIADYLNVPSS